MPNQKLTKLFSKRALQIIGAISICSLSTQAFAGGSATFHIPNVIRASVGMLLGYPNQDSYVKLTGGNGPPVNGIIGLTSTYAKTVYNGLISKYGTCASITNGTNITIDGFTPSLTIAAGKETIPSDWTDGGALFEKRVSFNVTDSNIENNVYVAIEFSCSNPTASYMAITMPMDGHNNAFTRKIGLFNGALSSGENVIASYMTECANCDNTSTVKVRGSNAVRVTYLTSDKSFKMWAITTKDTGQRQQHDGKNNLIQRFSINGNYETGIGSVFYDGVPTASNNGDNDGKIEHNSDLDKILTKKDLKDGNDAAPGHDFATNLNSSSTSGNEFTSQGCLTFLNNDNPTASTSDACPNFPFLDFTGLHPYLDKDSDFTIDWVLTTMPGKIELLP